MRRLLLLFSVVLAMAGSSAVSAGDGLVLKRAPSPAFDGTRVVRAAGSQAEVLASKIRYSPIPNVAAASGNRLLWTVQGYDCRACRRSCVVKFKLDCDEDDGWCRRQFTRCMRHCWEDECR